MSQVSIIDIAGGHPEIPTQFDANVGFAIPIANVIEILGEYVPAGTVPVQTFGSGNTITTQVQISQAIAASNIDNIGLAAFDSSDFNVDANGFVSLVGGGAAIDSILTNVDGPVSPDIDGQISILGTIAPASTMPLYTSGTIANTVNIIAQAASAQVLSDIMNAGMASFNSAQFTVDGNGHVSATGSVPIQFTTDSGVATPAAGNINVLGTGSTTTSGAGSTVTVALTGLTNHAVLVGAGTATITKVGPTATAGQILQSAGAAADPAFSTATYPSTTTINQLLYSSSNNVVAGLTAANSAVLVSTSAGVPVWSSTMTNGQLIIGNTGGTPTAAALTQGSGISITNGAGSITIAVSGSSVGQTITGDSGGALSPTAGNWNILGGPGCTTSGSGSTLTINSPAFTDTGATTLAVDNGYNATGAGTYNMPATAAQGELIIVFCDTAGAVVLDCPALNFIKIGSQATSSGGTATSNALGDSLTLRYRLSTLTWEAISVSGNWTLA